MDYEDAYSQYSESEHDDGADIMEAHEEYIQLTTESYAWEFICPNLNAFLQRELQPSDIQVLSISRLYWVLETSDVISSLVFRGYVRFEHKRTMAKIKMLYDKVFGPKSIWRPLIKMGLDMAMFDTSKLISGPWDLFPFKRSRTIKTWKTIDLVKADEDTIEDTDTTSKDSGFDTDIDEENKNDDFLDEENKDNDMYDDEESFDWN